MIIEIALGVFVAWVLIATIEFWLPLIFWLVVGVIGIAVGFVLIA